MQRRAFVQKLAVGAGLCLLPPGWLLARPYSRADGKADWIFRGGLIHTADPARPTAEAGRGGAVHVQDIARADTFHPGGPDHDGWQGHARVAVDCGAGGTTAGSGTADADVVRQSGLTGAPPSAGRDGVREPGPGAFKGLQGKATPRAAPRTAARLNAA